MTWLHWLMLAAVIYAVWQLLLIALDDSPERFEDVDALAKGSPGQPPGDAGTGTDSSSVLAARPGTIRGPLSNGRN